MLFQKISAMLHGKRTQRAATVRYFRPKLEILDERILLSTNTFTGAAGTTLWSNPANWSAGRIPNSQDQISAGQVTINGVTQNSYDDIPNLTVLTAVLNGVTLAGAPPMGGSGSSLTGQQYIDVEGPLVMMPGSTLDSLNYVYVYSSVSASATAGFSPSANIISPVVMLEPGATLVAAGGGTSTPALSITGNLNDYGAMSVGVVGGAPGSSSAMSVSGALTVEVGGTAVLHNGSTLLLNGGTLLDNGTVTMMGATIIGNVDIYGTFDSQGFPASRGPILGDTIQGDVLVSSGTLAIDTNAPHALDVTGNYTQHLGTLSVVITPQSGETQLYVYGTVALSAYGGPSTLKVTADGQLTPFASQWDLIVARGGITGDFGIFELPPSPVGNWATGVGVNFQGYPTYILSDGNP